MQPDIVLLPGYRLYEYVLVLSPHEDLRNKMLQVKKEFGEKYKAQSNIGGMPHITLATFTQMQMMEEKLLNRLKNIAMGFYPFRVELKDYGSFPSHTIFINVATKVEIRKLVKNLREAQRLMKSQEVKPHFITEPYIPIARKLLPWQYEKGILEMSHRQFTGKFIADGMLLLRRRQGDKAYQIVQRLEFQNLPVTTRQGSLFAAGF
ncbi:MAG: 2'-5' RNA ligase family protein [Chitinophagaceae bacterium]